MLLLRDKDIQTAAASINLLDDLEHMLGRSGEGVLEMPARTTISDAQGGFMRLMPAISPHIGYAGFKAMNLHAEHGVRYVITLISLETGEHVAMLDADWITAYRTAATAAIAVRRLKPAEVETVAMIGSGTQARALLDAAAPVLNAKRVLVFSPTTENREKFAREASVELRLDVQAVGSAQLAVRSSDVVLSAFRAKTTPVIQVEDVRPGAMVCGISSVRAHHREVDASLWLDSRVVVDDLPHVLESGDGVAALKHGANEKAISELWQVLRDPKFGRHAEDERVLFKSVGTAEQDIALAALVFKQAKNSGLGEDLGDFPALRPIQSNADRANLRKSG
jgi:alanine dehydrogenase